MNHVLFAAAALTFLGAGVAPARAGDRDGSRPAAVFTLGLVQREVRPGLSQAEVAERLGAPNILTRDAEGREAWVYDRISSEVEVSGHSLGLGALGSGSGHSLAAILGIGAGARSEKTRSSQRTLTVVIRFSAAGAVERFTWHDSRF